MTPEAMTAVIGVVEALFEEGAKLIAEAKVGTLDVPATLAKIQTLRDALAANDAKADAAVDAKFQRETP